MGKHKAGKSENVQVILRVRPLNAKETETGHKNVVHVDVANSCVSVDGAGIDGRQWTFDAVYNNSFTQKDVYLQTIHPVVESVLQGFNGTIFAYGQSGTGKTYSMCGSLESPERYGIIPNALNHIFQYIAENKSEKMEYYTQISFVELYNGKCRDLLVDGRLNLELKENAQKLFYVKDLSMWAVNSVPDAMSLMEQGLARRETKSTELNSDSSRSHSLYTLYIRVWDKEEDIRTESKLNLVDLAGSERQKQANTTGEALREGCNINLSLTALGTVIDCLVKSKPHIPYRSSGLTMLLKDGLGGNSRTVIVGTIGPSDGAASESVSTLRFIDRAKQIKNKPRIQMDPKDAKIAELLEEIKKLRRQLGIEEAAAEDDDDEEEGAAKPERKRSKVVLFDDEMEALRRRCEELEVQVEMSRSSIENASNTEVFFTKKEEKLRSEFMAKEAEMQAKISELADAQELLKISLHDAMQNFEQLRHICCSFLSALDKDGEWKATLSKLGEGGVIDNSKLTLEDIARGFKMFVGHGVDMKLHALTRQNSRLSMIWDAQRSHSIQHQQSIHHKMPHPPQIPSPDSRPGFRESGFCRDVPEVASNDGSDAQAAPGAKRHKKHKKKKSKKEGRDMKSVMELPPAVVQDALVEAGVDSPAVRAAVEHLLVRQRLLMNEQHQMHLAAAAANGDSTDPVELIAAVEELTDQVGSLTENLTTQKQQLEKVRSVAEKRMMEITQHKDHIQSLREELQTKHTQHAAELAMQQDSLVQQHNKKVEALLNKHAKALVKERKLRDTVQKRLDAAADERSKLEQEYDVKIMELEEMQHAFEEHKIDSLKRYRDQVVGYAPVDLGPPSSNAQMVATLRREVLDEERKSKGRDLDRLRAAVKGSATAKSLDLSLLPQTAPNERSSPAAEAGTRGIFSRQML